MQFTSRLQHDGLMWLSLSAVRFIIEKQITEVQGVGKSRTKLLDDLRTRKLKIENGRKDSLSHENEEEV